MAKKKKLKKKRFLGFIFILLLILGIIGGGIYYINYQTKYNMKKDYYVGSKLYTVSIYDNELNEVDNIIRGNKVEKYENRNNEKDSNYATIIYNNKEYFININNLVNTKEEVVQEKNMYVRTASNMYKELNNPKLGSLIKKGQEVNILGFDTLNEDGSVNMYKVSYNDEEGYFYSKYLLNNLEDAQKIYDEKNFSSKKNLYGGGTIKGLDYYPVTKPKFEDNVMPKNVYSLYLNCGVLDQIDSYIKLAKETKINAFVVDIMDDTSIGYESEVMKEYSKTSYKHAINSLTKYQKAVKKLKDEGFYVIGRMTTFKDSYYAKDHKQDGIKDTKGNLINHQGAYWPTAYSRNVWEYKIALAKEAVEKMGFNEIQFDYVRFPDGLGAREQAKTIDYSNTYSESKAQAIQRFLMYATEELHKLHVYVSADVFGEASWHYVTSYGQYWPAISNVVDVISAMPYTDHFGEGYGGYSEPWNHPYETMSTWAKTASDDQKITPTPAIARTWITAYDTPYWGITMYYNGEEIRNQVEALYKFGLDGGYMTWNSGSSLAKYKAQKSGFQKEYK